MNFRMYISIFFKKKQIRAYVHLEFMTNHTHVQNLVRAISLVFSAQAQWTIAMQFSTDALIFNM